MGLDGIIETIQGRSGEDNALTDGFDDISGGVSKSMGTQQGDGTSTTVYLETAGAVDVTVEFSPDGGDNWYEPQGESPVSFGGANQEIVHVNYNATDIRLTGSNTTGVKAQERVVA